MSRRLTIRLAFLALWVLGIGAVGATAAPAVKADPPTRTPIKHFVMLMQENHSFDNYFGTYPGANGPPAKTCIPINPLRPGSKCVKPFHVGGQAITDLDHSKLTHQEQFRGGHMDGFILASALAGGDDGRLSMGYYDQRDIPYYWNIADNYVLFDRFFTSAAGGSSANHLYWVTASDGNITGESAPAGGFKGIPTIFDRLDERGISWKFYVQNYDPRITFRHPGTGDRSSQIVWVPLLAFPRYLDTPRLRRHIVDLNQYHKDLAEGTLPSVAFIAPAGSSEHPPGSPKEGQRFIRSLVNGLMRSDYWTNSAFMWTYDDWGGWYDHVPPPAVDQSGYGFRAPALLVSAYAKKGYIDSTTLDFTSALKFIEKNWGVRPLTARDRNAKNFLTAFDFTSPPRPAVILPGPRIAAAVPLARRPGVVYPFYFAGFLLAMALIARAAWGSWWPRDRFAARKRRA